MPIRNKQVKQETRVDKIPAGGRLKSTEPPARGRAKDTGDAPQVSLPSGGQSRWGVQTQTREAYRNIRVPVLDQNNQPVMPTKASRARRWVREDKATGFFKRGIFCVRLKFTPSNNNKQDVCLGIDPGSKFEGFTVKSKQSTFINIQTGAVTWVKKSMKTRREMRRTRRNRKTPCRKPRFYRNRNKPFLPPSTKARWGWKLRESQK